MSSDSKKAVVPQPGDLSFGRLTAARLAGEFATDIGARGTTFLFQKILGQGHTAAVQFMRDAVVLPHLDKFEATMDQWLPALEKPTARLKRLSQTPEARAQFIASSMLNLSTDFLGGYVAQVLGQQVLDKIFHVRGISTAQQAKVAFVDRTLQIGSFIALNPVGKDVNIAAQDKLGDFYHKLLNGVGIRISEEKADWYASQTMNVRLPNLLGMVGTLFAHRHYANNPQK